MLHIFFVLYSSKVIQIGSRTNICLIVDPFGQMVMYNILKSEPNALFVEYNPLKVGTYSTKVFYGTRPIEPSPLLCYVFDLAKCSFFEAIPTGVIGQTLSFVGICFFFMVNQKLLHSNFYILVYACYIFSKYYYGYPVLCSIRNKFKFECFIS